MYSARIKVVECDIFKPEVLDFTEVDLIVSCLGFHRRNNKQFKIDHYTRSMDSILTAAEIRVLIYIIIYLT